MKIGLFLKKEINTFLFCFTDIRVLISDLV